MAMNNGLLLQTARHWAAAIREADGTIHVASGQEARYRNEGRQYPARPRGDASGRCSAVLPAVKAKLGGAVMPLQGAKVAGALGASAIGTLALRRRKGGSVLTQEVMAAFLALAPAVVALRDSPLARYHGAEHKSIGEFERLGRGESPAEATKEHERCGSNVVGPLLMTTMIANAAVRAGSRRPTPLATAVASLVSLGSAMEMFRWMTKHPESTFARVMSGPGHALQQYLTTEEPTEEQMAVAHAALAELLRVEGVGIEQSEPALS